MPHSQQAPPDRLVPLQCSALKHNTTLLERYPTFFCENLVDYNEARMKETTLKFHTHA